MKRARLFFLLILFFTFPMQADAQERVFEADMDYIRFISFTDYEAFIQSDVSSFSTVYRFSSDNPEELITTIEGLSQDEYIFTFDGSIYILKRGEYIMELLKAGEGKLPLDNIRLLPETFSNEKNDSFVPFLYNYSNEESIIFMMRADTNDNREERYLCHLDIESGVANNISLGENLLGFSPISANRCLYFLVQSNTDGKSDKDTKVYVYALDWLTMSAEEIGAMPSTARGFAYDYRNGSILYNFDKYMMRMSQDGHHEKVSDQKILNGQINISDIRGILLDNGLYLTCYFTPSHDLNALSINIVVNE